MVIQVWYLNRNWFVGMIGKQKSRIFFHPIVKSSFLCLRMNYRILNFYKGFKRRFVGCDPSSFRYFYFMVTYSGIEVDNNKRFENMNYWLQDEVLSDIPICFQHFIVQRRLCWNNWFPYIVALNELFYIWHTIYDFY